MRRILILGVLCAVAWCSQEDDLRELFFKRCSNVENVFNKEVAKESNVTKIYQREGKQIKVQYNATFYCVLAMLAKSVGQFKLTGLVYLDSGTKKRSLPTAEMSKTLNEALKKYTPLGQDELAQYPFGCRVETGSVREKRKIPKRKAKKRGKKPKFVIVPVFRAYCLAITKEFMEFFAPLMDYINKDLKQITNILDIIKRKME